MGNVIGNTSKRASRFAKRFNLENRVNKVLEKDKPDLAPRHETTSKILEQFAADNPELYEEQKKKDLDLHERLKQIRLESTGSLPEIKSRRLPERDRLNEPKISGYRGFLDQQKVPEGRLSIRDAMKILGKVQISPVSDPSAVKNIAKEYKLDELHVKQLLRHFKAMEMKFPNHLLKKHPSLAENLAKAGQKSLDNWVSGIKSDQEAFENLKTETKDNVSQRWKNYNEKIRRVPKDEEDEDYDWTETKKQLNIESRNKVSTDKHSGEGDAREATGDKSDIPKKS
ncbi:NADH dehydrogenase [ubiquinone] 1 alpha subcomplex assembly factor 4-like [Pecten maximus]|uniref:NADH dehydrogenase [ubiquinone] 1 alpha subcomplex assembly factor 4-like n=1 Tax=Pecten maximus TaxID=6579 RepID=UPI0014584527|nr:NADH dehydrogenase [ubiquinone] 1 alpha subcomplex assembly factor 4-like [Pecten maximus]